MTRKVILAIHQMSSVMFWCCSTMGLVLPLTLTSAHEPIKQARGSWIPIDSCSTGHSSLVPVTQLGDHLLDRGCNLLGRA